MLSIITINYNRKSDLEATLKSVAEQSYGDFEYVVIDGGSTDGSVELLKSYSDEIDYWVSEPDKGIFDAMNKGIQAAKGEYLLFLNGGDIFLHPDALANAVDHLKSCKEDIVYGDIMVEMSYGGELRFSYPDTLNFRYFLEHDLPHQATFIRRQLFDQYGLYDPHNKINADWTFFVLTICKHQVSYRHIPCTFTRFQQGGITETMTKLERVRSQESFLMEHFGMFYPDILRLVQSERNSLKAKSYRFAAGIAKRMLAVYFRLGGRSFGWLEGLKPGYRVG